MLNDRVKNVLNQDPLALIKPGIYADIADHRDMLMRQAVDAGFIAYRAGQSNQLPKGVIKARDE